MGIRFACQQCGNVMNVKEFLAGKRGICDQCQAKVDIPLQSTVEKIKTSEGTVYRPIAQPQGGQQPAAHAAQAPGPATAVQTPTAAATQPAARAGEPTTDYHVAPTAAPQTATGRGQSWQADPIEENPDAVWYVLPPGGTTQFGPAPGALFRNWIEQGRVGPDSLVWREDWPDWRRAADALPQLNPTQLPPSGIAVAAPISEPVWTDQVEPRAVDAALGPATLAKAEYELQRRRRTRILVTSLVTLVLLLMALIVVVTRFM